MPFGLVLPSSEFLLQSRIFSWPSALFIPKLRGMPPGLNPHWRSLFLIPVVLLAIVGYAREPWTTSRIKGAPEAPPPYRIQRRFESLKFREPVDLCTLPGSNRFFLLELSGRIYSFTNGQEKAELTFDLKKLHPEMDSAYGITFDPGYRTNHFLYACYVYKGGITDGSKVSRFKLTAGPVPVVEPDSEKVLITWLAGGHNGGCLKFGPDGYLYISTGDGGGPNPPDPLNTGQDNTDLLSCILRIDVHQSENGKPYRVPRDNPFLGVRKTLPEIWAYGFRNPWKISFDRETGDLWAGDVGWELWELVFKVQKGGNYGWSVVEGRQSIKPDSARGLDPILSPVIDLPHSEAASMTGGFVYRGSKLQELRGVYIFGDWTTGKIWGLRYDGTRVTWMKELAVTGQQIISFAEDNDGELWILDYSGMLHQLERAQTSADLAKFFPRKLSDTGLFQSVPEHKLSPGVRGYRINAEAWADNAQAQRFVAVPDAFSIQIEKGAFRYPSNTVFGKTFSIETERGNKSSTTKLETQILHYDGITWHGYTYEWNKEQTDGVLVEAPGVDHPLTIRDPEAPGGKRNQTWHLSSRAECLRCHNTWAGPVLAFNFQQIYPQLAALLEEKYCSTREKLPEVKSFVSPYPSDVPIAERARTYLHVNCSHCHRDGAGGSVPLQLVYGVPEKDLKIVDIDPNQGSFGISAAHIVTKGDPYASTLYYRILSTGPSRMPRIGSSVVDVAGANVIHDWIKSLDSRSAEASGSTSEALAAITRINKGNAQKEMIAQTIRSSNPFVQDLVERFIPEDQKAQKLGAVVKPDQILSLKGEGQRGRAVFFSDAGPQCKRCHQVQTEGIDFGPDLSHVGKKFDRGQILESILFPSKLIEPAFAMYSVETTDDLSYTGLLLGKNETEVTIKDQNQRKVKIPLKQVKRLEAQQLSVMPELLLQGMTPQSVADLVEFLSEQK